MVWSTKSLGRAKEYVVIKHRLSDFNNNLLGIRFRGGYAVVEKGGKSYKAIKQLPFIKDQPEFPLIHLRDLKFITRTNDIKIIFGQDVYYQYLDQLNKVLEAEKIIKEQQKNEEHINVRSLCSHTTAKGTLCEHLAMPESPSKYCRLHILNDPKLEEIGIKIPKRLSKDEKKSYKEKVLAKLERMSR